ncbi:MAG: hypothetical protein AB199_01100 [Parcubacteria bacterium C7867-004]|nr:MAG: hypothetical protein AB199_01100 [Parcubacteria bacterium C7867-004]
MHPLFRNICIAIGVLFAIIGLVFTAVFFAMQFGLLNVRGSIEARNSFFSGATTTSATSGIPAQPCLQEGMVRCQWDQTPEWNVVKGGLEKDRDVIIRVERETGIKGRMMAAAVMPEQIRFFTSNREVFKRYFEPLKILGSLSQFSLGVSGIKQETARQVEIYANDPASPFYPGAEASALIAYPEGIDRDAELFRRLTDEKDHYYSYLYTALFMKEVAAQWANAGFDIDENPEAIVTLFNIGFAKSIPNANPQVGGAPITAGGMTYAFGELGANFYRSGELLDIFPR